MAWATFFGTTIEWFDYYIYGIAAATVFAPQFFPSIAPIAGVLAAFTTFAVGFLARPIGGLVLGHLGDRFGRKPMLVLSIMLMGIATVGIGLLPNYAAIGVFAPILLTVLRLVQGFGIGGEWGGAVVLAVEHAPEKKKNLFGAFPQMGSPAGTILANATFLIIIATLGPTAYTQWGWRIPFLCSAVLVIIGVAIRLRIAESPEFTAVRNRRGLVRRPLIDALRRYPRAVLCGIGISLASPLLGNILTVWVQSYGLTFLHTEQGMMTALVTLLGVEWLLVILFAALLSDRFGAKTVFLVTTTYSALWAFPFFALLSTRDPVLMVIAFVGAAPAAGPFAALPALLTSWFPVAIRFTGVSIGYQVGSVLAGGFAPLIATALVAWTATAQSVAAYVAAVCLLSVASLLINWRSDGPRRGGEPEPNAVSLPGS
ncbi:MFS transporter [Leifsonia aquatica]|uniref:MFS transporter n=1 Tax=Leifsonia aquatica TaxID=144185 RepID=UPI00384EA4DB